MSAIRSNKSNEDYKKLGVHQRCLPVADVLTIMDRISFSPRALSASKMIFTETAIKVDPLMHSMSSKYTEFMKELCLGLEALPKGTTDDWGVFDRDPFIGDPKDILVRAGTHSFPLDFPAVSYRGTTSSNPYVHQLAKTVEHLVRYACRGRLPEYGRFNKKSSSGYPMFTSDVEYKKETTEHIIDEFSDVIKAYKEKDLRTLLDDYHILFMCHTQIRDQDDAFEKTRFRTEFGHVGPTQELPYKSKDRDGMIAKRTRTVAAYANALNYVISVVLDGIRKWVELRYEKTFKHRSGDEVAKKIHEHEKMIKEKFGEDFICISQDFSRFDSTIPMEVMEGFINGLPIDDTLKSMMKDMMYVPRFACSDGEDRLLLEADPLDYENLIFYRGQTSGNSWTSIANKFIAIGFLMMAMCYENILAHTDDMLPTKSAMEDFLQQRAKVATNNNGDDGQNFGVKNMVLRMMERAKSFMIFKIEVSNVCKLNGMLFYWSYDSSNRKILKWCYSMLSYLLGCWSPEHGIDSLTHRPFPMLGRTLRRSKQVYGTNPLFDQVAYFERVAYHKVTNHDLYAIEAAHMRVPDPDNAIFKDLTHADLELIANPSAVFYKDLEEHVKNTILEEVTFTIDKIKAEHFVSKYTSVPLYHNKEDVMVA